MTLGTKAEWRVRRDARPVRPYALVLLLHLQKDLGAETVEESRYVVVKLRPFGACVTASIDSKRGDRQAVAREADRALGAKCR
ncbi:MAG TPA: hypothetical protein VEC35_10270 [Noviherbaspirillum sp.]|nr:hypothetical protein [Noviherbaspirillum sp.]